MIALRDLLSPLLFGSLLATVSAQSLQLDVIGGSLPGDITMTVAPALNPFELMMIVPSTTAGPTPIGLFDPNDPRSLSIGLDLLGFAWPVAADLNLVATQQVSLTASPVLIGQALFFQAVTFQWQPTILDRISNGSVVRFGSEGEFEDRNVFMFEQRAFATALQRPDGSALVVGGARGQLLAQLATDTTEVYDPITDSFSYGPLMTTPRSMHTMTELQNGTFLLTGGVDGANNPQSTCEVYDPVANTFTLVASMNSPRMGQTATLLADGRVFITGGLDALTVTPTQLSAIHDAVDTTEIYDPVLNTWTNGPAMSDPRAAHMALHRPDGKILLCGGISWDTNFLFGWVPTVRSSCDLYDPANNTMNSGPSMSTSRALTDAVEMAPGQWLVAGGMNGLSIIPYNPGNPTATAEIYNSSTNTWTTVGSLASPRANLLGWAIGNGQFLLAGGGAGSILSPTPLSATEIFDTATNTFSPGPTMNSGRAGAGMMRTPQGQVFLFGGAATSSMITTTTEWYFF
ncbi:MAG: hypothetical protein ACI89X_000427 [Planctomycetota bacterium]|jgi:hypothetical protein